jgi:hypothetical protein
MNFKNILKVFVLLILFLSLTVFIFKLLVNVLFKKNNIEGLSIDTSIIMNKNDAFCESLRGSSGSLDESCNRLTKDNCNDTNCCVWKSPGKCVAGNANGPTFNTDSNGKTHHIEYYYYKNKCYGEKCL